ncbi:MAG: MBL fold metallo-hydrolase [Candidatus Aenigmarchaeota archaeon]|nr:MBL fold metallo-hydrolase [Candidatus Aenigmarchaeota archaeon]
MPSTLVLDNVEITWLGHASFLIKGSKVIYIDPFVLPSSPEKADYILVTHDHYDHCDAEKIKQVRKDSTIIISSKAAAEKIQAQVVMKPGDVYKHGIEVEAVPAYNVDKFRSPDMPFHPKGAGLGFVVEIDGKRIYHAGDTDNITEMHELHRIDAALMPVGGTYTMTASEAGEAAAVIKPKFLIPMHYRSDKYGLQLDNDISPLAKALAGKGIVLKVLEPVA